MNKELSLEESKTLYCLKALSILSVIAAHTVSVSNVHGLKNAITSFWALYGQIGVVTFFVLGGFFYKRSTGDFVGFWKKKLLTMVIPWIFCSTLTFILALLRGKEFSLFQYMKWVVGSGTWYYYISMYLLFMLMFKCVHKYDLILILISFITPIALVLKSLNSVETADYVFITDSLRLQHWISFFSIGILIRKYGIMHYFYGKKPLTLSMIISVGLGVYLHYNSIYSYFNIISMVFELSFGVVLLNISRWIVNYRVSHLLETVGKRTFCIYLLHMQIVQAVDNRFSVNLLFELLMPFLGFALMYILTEIGLIISKKLPKGQFLCCLVGLKE